MFLILNDCKAFSVKQPENQQSNLPATDDHIEENQLGLNIRCSREHRP